MHITDLLVAAGASVAIGGRSQEKAEASAARHASGTIGLAVDVVDEQSVDGAVAEVVDRLGGLDVLVNCASVLVEQSADDLDPDDWRRTLETNLTGAFWLSRSAARAMREAGRGGRHHPLLLDAQRGRRAARVRRLQREQRRPQCARPTVGDGVGRRRDHRERRGAGIRGHGVCRGAHERPFVPADAPPPHPRWRLGEPWRSPPPPCFSRLQRQRSSPVRSSSSTAA